MDQRIHNGIRRGNAVNLKINGQSVTAYIGETIGAVLVASGYKKVRGSLRLKEPRGHSCCVGVCYQCLVTVNGRANVRACVTPVEQGQEIVLQESVGHYGENLEPSVPAKQIHLKSPIVIIGGGPAGLSAAISAAKMGAKVIVIDENKTLGGQVYRQWPSTFDIKGASFSDKDSADGQMLLKQIGEMADSITIWKDSTVWSASNSRRLTITRNNNLVFLDADAVIIAVGAYERILPVQGWTLPGVMTSGGAQVLLKNQLVRPGRRALFAGSGPLQLVIANQMLKAGMEIVAVAESATFFDKWPYCFGLIHQPQLAAKGLKYLFNLKKSKVRLLRPYMLRSVGGHQAVERVVLNKVDSRFRPIPGMMQSFEVDTVCIGYGLIPSVQLTSMIGCTHSYQALQNVWTPDYDKQMQTSKEGVFVAGDGAGVAGALVARYEGALAGMFAAAHVGATSFDKAKQTAQPVYEKLTSLYKFRKSMDRIYPAPPVVNDFFTEDTVICRCEDVTAGDIFKAIHNGAIDLNSIKRLTRVGMGYCQGVTCMPVVAAILAQETGIRPECIDMMTPRPPLKPVTFNTLGA